MKDDVIGGIIIEGPDQAGKSFIADKLKDILGYEVYHFSKPGANTDFRLEYIQPILQSEKPYIFDRSYVSEMAYGAVHRGGGGITPEIKEYVENFLNSRNYVLVYMQREPGREWIQRDEMYSMKDNDDVIAQYERIYPSIGIPKMTANSYDPQVIDKIMEFYKKHNPSYVERQN